MRVFRDRHDAGAQLAGALRRYADAPEIIVLAHTRRSVQVAYEVATRLGLPLDMIARDEIARDRLPFELVIGDGCDDTAHQLDLDLEDRTILLIDDGDGAREMPAMIERVRALGARAVVAGVAVASPQVCALLHTAADHAVCVLSPQHIYATEAWYADLTEPSAADIRQLLVAAAQNILSLRRGNFLIRAVDT